MDSRPDQDTAAASEDGVGGEQASTSVPTRPEELSIHEAIDLLLTRDLRDIDPQTFSLAASRVIDTDISFLTDLAVSGNPCLASVYEQLGGPSVQSELGQKLWGELAGLTAFLDLLAAMARAFQAEAYFTPAQSSSLQDRFFQFAEAEAGRLQMADSNSLKSLFEHSPMPLRASLGLTASFAPILQIQFDLIDQIRAGPAAPRLTTLKCVCSGLGTTMYMLLLVHWLLDKAPSAKSAGGAASQDAVPPGLAALVSDIDGCIARLAREELLTSVRDMPAVFSQWAGPGREPLRSSASSSSAGPSSSPSQSASFVFSDLLPDIFRKENPAPLSSHFGPSVVQFLVTGATMFVLDMAQLGIGSSAFALSVPGLVVLSETLYFYTHQYDPANTVVIVGSFALGRTWEVLVEWLFDSASDIPPDLKGAVLTRLAAILFSSADRALQSCLSSPKEKGYGLHISVFIDTIRRILPVITCGLEAGLVPASDAAILFSRAGRAAGLAGVLSVDPASGFQSEAYAASIYHVISSFNFLCAFSPPQWLALRRDLRHVTFPLPAAQLGGPARINSVLELLQGLSRALTRSDGRCELCLGYFGTPAEKAQAADAVHGADVLQSMINNATCRLTDKPLFFDTMDFASQLPGAFRSQTAPSVRNDSFWEMLGSGQPPSAVDLGLFFGALFDSSGARKPLRPNSVAATGPLLLSYKLSLIIDGALASDRCRRDCRSKNRGEAARSYVAKLKEWSKEARALRRWLLHEALPAAEAAEAAEEAARGEGGSGPCLGLGVKEFLALQLEDSS